MTTAYRSTLELSSTCPAGLLMRQTHHWAALVFVAAMVVHLHARVLHRRVPQAARAELAARRRAAGAGDRSRASPATRCPTTCSRAWAWPSPTASRCRSRWSAAQLGALVWGGQFPGPGAIESRLFIVHVFVLPGPHGRADRRAPGARSCATTTPSSPGPAAARATSSATPMWPGYALRSLGLLLRGRRGARAARRARADQPGLAVGPVRARPRDERRAARLVPRAG